MVDKKAFLEPFDKSVQVLKSRFPSPETYPKTALICGSGFKSLVDTCEIIEKISLSDIPGLLTSTVSGHGNELVLAKFKAGPSWILTGRVHMYEGHTAQQVVASVCLFAALGVRNLCLTNAAGSLNPELKPGMIVGLSDHLNLTGQNCLIGFGQLGPEKFVSMANAYDSKCLKALQETARLPVGVYAGLLGPNYETIAECRMLRGLGADLVGMSTVQETIAARFLGIRVVGLSLVTNMAGGTQDQPISHSEVLDVGGSAASDVHKLANAVTRIFAEHEDLT